MRALAFAAVMVLVAQPASAADKEASWPDPNFVLCEGIGGSGTGRITAGATFTTTGNAVNVTSLIISGAYQHPRQMSGSISYTRPDGSSAQVNLARPWFPTIGPPGVQSLSLPRRADSPADTSGQTPFNMRTGSSITIRVSNLFTTPGGNCPASFETTWMLP